MKRYFLPILAMVAVGAAGFVLGIIFSGKSQLPVSKSAFDEPMLAGIGVIQGTVTEEGGTLACNPPHCPAIAPVLTSEVVLLANSSGMAIIQATPADSEGRFRFSVLPGSYLVGMPSSRLPSVKGMPLPTSSDIKDFTRVDVSLGETQTVNFDANNNP